jgi:hypothetical protein
VCRLPVVSRSRREHGPSSKLPHKQKTSAESGYKRYSESKMRVSLFTAEVSSFAQTPNATHLQSELEHVTLGLVDSNLSYRMRPACLSWHPFIGSNYADCVLRSTVSTGLRCGTAAYGLLFERRDKKACKFHQFFWASRERVLYKE